ncbi:G patch domain-containing protein 1 [Cryptococcus neoformans 125.91]|nr:G patch domain-containing protein 1 [Cryptococcus neoformans var. grubii 125.91]
MTSRLKHKLELDQVNLNSAYLNESFVQIGTPLPALADTKKDKLEYVPEWKQEVRDEQGRRRFHGAFTGGWSAGYFNSAGSKEGWAPSTFKSSRSSRASKIQRPEDFMDEEDLQQMRDDRQLENTDIFKNEAFAGTREPLADKNLPSALESLIAPAQSSIGEKLLQKLGWRPGQGIGPRVTLRKLRIQEGKLGKARLGMDDSGHEDAEAGKHTFAPRDVKLLVYESKEDKQGLGFEKGKGMSRLPPAMGPRPLDNEDDDPYAVGPSTSSRPFAFDHNDDEDDVIVMGGSARPGLGMRSTDVGGGQKAVDGEDHWHDGRPVLVGFMLDPKGVPQDKWFPMPEIPVDWRPRPARVWGTTRKWDEEPGKKVEENEVIKGAPGKPLTHEQRGAALGEETRMSKAKSVYEYIAEKDRERLASLSDSAQIAPPPKLSFVPEPSKSVEHIHVPATEVQIPPLSPRTASAALKGFIPYGDDPAKQERYRSYLVSQTYNTKEPNPTILPSSSFDEINAELEAFASSARIFKPMSFAMSNRFTSGSSSLAASDLKQAKPGLHIYDAEKAKAEMEKPKGVDEIKVEKQLTPREQAAMNGMYGKMTRETKQFYPVKLLCKRFGVADPHPEGKSSDSEAVSGLSTISAEGLPLPANDASWESKFTYQAPTESSKPTLITQSSQVVTGERAPTSIAEVGMADDINQGRDTLTYTKPSIDIFKAIFASDNESGGEDADDDEKQVDQPGKVAGPTQAYRDPFPPKKAEDEKPVDLTTFKPVFTLKKEDNGAKDDKKEKKKDKKSKKRKSMLSFDIGEGEEEDAPKQQERNKKKRKDDEQDNERHKGEQRNKKHKNEREENDFEGEWVEKPAIIPRLVGRKGAEDFM